MRLRLPEPTRPRLAGSGSHSTGGRAWHAGPVDQARLSRRAVLAIVAGVGVAACSPASDGGDATASPDGDATVTAQVCAQEWELVGLYDAAIAAQPSLASALAPIRPQHADHAAALGSTSPPPPSTSLTPSFATEGSTRSALAEAETAASRDRARACQAVVSAEPARLLALIAASEAGHAAYLRGPSA